MFLRLGYILCLSTLVSLVDGSLRGGQTLVTNNETFLCRDWLQLYSNEYVQSTSEINYACVSVHVSCENDGNMTVTKRAYQHHNEQLPIEWTTLYTPKWREPSSQYFEDNLVLQPAKNTSFLVVPLYLRQILTHSIIWTGLDNKTMYVWGDNVNVSNDAEILTKLSLLDFQGHYKRPLSSYDKTCPQDFS